MSAAAGVRAGSLQTIVTEGVPRGAEHLVAGAGPSGTGTTVAHPWPNNLADLEQVRSSRIQPFARSRQGRPFQRFQPCWQLQPVCYHAYLLDFNSLVSREQSF